MLHSLLPALFLVLLALAGLGITLLFRKPKFYEHSSIEKNPHMKKLGITCVKNDELDCQSSPNGCEGCAISCR